tara:strand:+ start:650 stop:892 length:243 start_codon:yes stop_codon:yes gene_type:complete
MDRPIKELIIPQQVFDIFLDHIDKFVSFHVKNEGAALIMAEALIVKIKQLFIGKGYVEEDALLFIEHALQELNDDKPTIH